MFGIRRSVITKMSCGNAPNSNIPPRRKLSPLHGRTLIYRRKGNRGAVLFLLGYEKSKAPPDALASTSMMLSQ